MSLWISEANVDVLERLNAELLLQRSVGKNAFGGSGWSLPVIDILSKLVGSDALT